jgi:prevent-host-death family protein
LHKPSIGLREVKANLSRLIKEVKEGAEIILTERGKPVARLIPSGQDSLSLEQRLAQLERSGWIEPLKSKKRKLPPPLPLPGKKVQEFLQEERNK